MKFASLRKDKKLMSGFTIIIYEIPLGDKVYHNILPVGYSRTGSKMYNGLLTRVERDYYDNIFKKYENYIIRDKEVDIENGLIFIEIEKEKS